jgi:hypothetical protein
MHQRLSTQSPDSQVTNVRTGLSRLTGRPGLVVSALAWIGAVLLVLSAVIHLHLWAEGYQHIPTIGPLFLLQGVVGIIVAAVVALLRRLIVLAGAAIFAIGTIGGLLLSVFVGLFGFQDSLGAPYATASLVIESIAFAVLASAAALTLILHRETLVRGRPIASPRTLRATE